MHPTSELKQRTNIHGPTRYPYITVGTDLGKARDSRGIRLDPCTQILPPTSPPPTHQILPHAAQLLLPPTRGLLGRVRPFLRARGLLRGAVGARARLLEIGLERPRAGGGVLLALASLDGLSLGDGGGRKERVRSAVYEYEK